MPELRGRGASACIAGWQPQDEPIDTSLPLDQPLICDLPLRRACEELCSEGHDVSVSVDPGRFVCNYTFFASMQRAAQHDACWSVFVHVPHFEQVCARVCMCVNIDMFPEYATSLSMVPSHTPTSM